MKNTKYLKSKIAVYLTIGLLCFFTEAFGQKIETLSISDLPLGTVVKGLYMIQVDDGTSNKYLRESSGELKRYTLNRSDGRFYFWITENVWTGKFQIYNGRYSHKIVEIQSNGKGKLKTVQPGKTKPENNLLFRMYSSGAEKTADDSINGIVAIGHIITEELESSYGNNKCHCNVLETSNKSKFILRKVQNSEFEDYRPIAFEKAGSNSNGSIQKKDSYVKISQSSTSTPRNFVSSKFFIGGFGESDYKVTFENSSANGSVGFVDYQYHHLKSNVYVQAQPKIGLKAENGVISLFYLSGNQPLPYSSEEIEREINTDFNFNSPISFGFKDQYTFVATQGSKTYALDKIVPTEVFLNQSITKSGRMLVRMKKGTVRLSYSPENNTFNSPDDFGHDNGDGFISTNSYFPYNIGNKLINTFDWQESQWNIRYYGDNGTVDELVYSPFYENNQTFSSIAAHFSPSGEYLGAEDFAVEEGWELIKANLGYQANGKERGVAPDVPYVIFYNKIASILRVFLFANNHGEANQLTVSLGIDRGRPGNHSNDPAYTPKLWGSLQQFKSLDAVKPSCYSKGMPFYSTAGRKWYFTDFTMEYDPCIAFFESSIEVKLNKITDGEVSMVGRYEGGSLPAGTEEYDSWRTDNENFLVGVMDNSFGDLDNTLGDITFNQYENFDLMDFEESIGGTLIGKDIAAWEKEKARIEWEATNTIGHGEIAAGRMQIAEGLAVIAEGTATMTGGIPFFGDMAKDITVGGIKVGQGIIKTNMGDNKIKMGRAKLDLAYAKKMYYDNIKDKVKHSDQEIKLDVPVPRPSLVFGEMALKGKLTIETSIMPEEEYIATPGGLNSDKAPEFYNNGSRGGAPLYNMPMGNFSLLNQPKFAVGIAKDGNYFNAHLKIKEKPYFAFNNRAAGKTGDLITVAIKVETINSADNARVVNVSTGDSYTTVFGRNEANPLPGNIDITYLVDWNQIRENINSLSDKSNANIEAHLQDWIRISYHVWSLTLSNLKGRDLRRTMGNTSQFYTGISEFAMGNGFNARSVADSRFKNYSFKDNSTYKLGDRYNIYSSDDDFVSLMREYCNCLEDNSRAHALKHSPEINLTESRLIEEVNLEIKESKLEVYPNPASTVVNFNILSDETGEAGIGLYDIAGQNLISTTDWLNGRNDLYGRINIDVLKAGTYFIIVHLPGGKTLSQKIIKN